MCSDLSVWGYFKMFSCTVIVFTFQNPIYFFNTLLLWPGQVRETSVHHAPFLIFILTHIIIKQL